MLRIHLFGPLRIFDDETLLPPLNPSKASALLAYLLLKRNHPISRDQAAFILWPEISEAEARANLRRHLHLLRRSLPPPPSAQTWVTANHETIQWNRNTDHWLDVQDFERAASTNEDQMTALQTAADLYMGDLLDGMYEDWMLAERERLRSQYGLIVERLAGLQETAGDLRNAITTYKRLLSTDPLKEETHRKLMQLHYWVGDRAAALRQYEECKKLLWETFNVEPMSETRALSMAISDSQIIPRKSTSTSKVTQSLAAESPRSPSALDTTPTPQKLEKQTGNTPTVLKSRLSIWSFLALLGVVAGFILFKTFSNSAPPLETIIFSGSAVAQDTWLSPEFPNSGFDPDFSETLFKDYTQVHLQYYETGIDRFLIRFDLDALSVTDIEAATLSIYLETWTSDVGETALQRAYPAKVTAYRITQPWQVESASFNFPWSQPGLQPGMDYDAHALDSQLINGTDEVVFNITPAVRMWLEQPETNWGVMLKIENAPESVAHYWVNTTEHTEQSQRPQLKINYHK